MHGVPAARLSEDDSVCTSVVWRRMTAALSRSRVEMWMGAGTIKVCSVVRRKHFCVRLSTKREHRPQHLRYPTASPLSPQESSSVSTFESSSRSTPTFFASMDFVKCVKRDLHLSAQKPSFERKSERVKWPEVKEQRELKAIECIDDVHRSVLRNGARFVVRADETSCKLIHLSHTLFAAVGGDHPPVIHSNHTNKEAFSVTFATTASGAKLKSAVIISPRRERAMRAFAHLTSRVHIV